VGLASRQATLRVISVVDRPRPGLAELSLAFATHARSDGHDVGMLHAVDEQQAAIRWSFWRMVREARSADLVVLWSFGWSTLLLPLARMMTRRTEWSVVLHEPGGLAAKLAKGDNWLRAVISAILELVALKWADWILVPRADKVSVVDARNVVALPLLHLEDNNVAATPRQGIFYFGRRDPRRKLALFGSTTFRQVVRHSLPDCTFDFFPPDPKIPGSMAEKWHAWRSASAVLNFYTVPYNQSGVTVEAMLHGVPVLVSDFDPFADNLRPLGLALPPTADDETIAQALASGGQRREDLRQVLYELGSRLGGQAAFRAHWAPWLIRVISRKGGSVV
jgi:hypothetical protein